MKDSPFETEGRPKKAVSLKRLDRDPETWRATYADEKRDFTGTDGKPAVASAMEWLEGKKERDYQLRFGKTPGIAPESHSYSAPKGKAGD